MNQEIEDTIKALTQKAQTADTSYDTLNYTQAVLNLAYAANTLDSIASRTAPPN